MRGRAIQSCEHAAEIVRHALDHAAELACDGRTLVRPVNCLLVRIIPVDGIVIDPRKRPFVVVQCSI
jgi:hypothetical protein